MPTSDQGGFFTYPSANTRISEDHSRSVCVTYRARKCNTDNILISFGSFDTTWNKGKGCNTHFALAIVGANRATVYGMCGSYDNHNIPIQVGSRALNDGSFHQLCASYNTQNARLCLYFDLNTPTCLTRKNPRYQTSLGDIRIGWWTDNNRQFIPDGGGLIRSASLFDREISQECVRKEFDVN